MGTMECRGADLNRGTTAGQGPKPCAVGQSWLPLRDVDCWQMLDEIIKDVLVALSATHRPANS